MNLWPRFGNPCLMKMAENGQLHEVAFFLTHHIIVHLLQKALQTLAHEIDLVPSLIPPTCEQSLLFCKRDFYYHQQLPQHVCSTTLFPHSVAPKGSAPGFPDRCGRVEWTWGVIIDDNGIHPNGMVGSGSTSEAVCSTQLSALWRPLS